ncbi:hypothetical protein [Colwellia sp. MEBiC06753]
MNYFIIYVVIGVLYTLLSLWYFGSDKRSRGLPKLDKDKYLSEQLAEWLFMLVVWAVLSLFWPIVLTVHIKHALFPVKEPEPFSVKKADLIEQLTIEQIEQDEMVFDPLGAVPNVPFGFLNGAWIDFISKKDKDSTIWSFRAVDKTSISSEIKKGFALVSAQGEILHVLKCETFYTNQ